MFKNLLKDNKPPTMEDELTKWCLAGCNRVTVLQHSPYCSRECKQKDLDSSATQYSPNTSPMTLTPETIFGSGGLGERQVQDIPQLAPLGPSILEDGIKIRNRSRAHRVDQVTGPIVLRRDTPPVPTLQLESLPLYAVLEKKVGQVDELHEMEQASRALMAMAHSPVTPKFTKFEYPPTPIKLSPAQPSQLLGINKVIKKHRKTAVIQAKLPYHIKSMEWSSSDLDDLNGDETEEESLDMSPEPIAKQVMPTFATPFEMHEQSDDNDADMEEDLDEEAWHDALSSPISPPSLQHPKPLRLKIARVLYQ